ncbi:Hypothetical predicted protein, partial [Mytilus galloprovincialis]
KERQRELASKREARKNEDFKKELAAKREVRKIERQRELVAKREVRKDKIIEGLKQKVRSQRDNYDLRQIEDKENLLLKESRKDKNYRRAEAESKKSQKEKIRFKTDRKTKRTCCKREVRKDKIIEGLKLKVRSLKRNSDLRQMERQKRIVAKKEARKNENFKRNETEKKKIARQDENYRKHESERDFHRKQEYRSHPENLEMSV